LARRTGRGHRHDRSKGGGGRYKQLLDWSYSASSLLVLFIPSRERLGNPVAQDAWVEKALALLGKLLGGATAFPRGRGIWRDDERDGALLPDEPVIIHCYTSERSFLQHASELRAFLVRMGAETRQGAVAFVFNDDYFEIRFPSA
jgi:hypothetical protein